MKTQTLYSVKIVLQKIPSFVIFLGTFFWWPNGSTQPKTPGFGTGLIAFTVEIFCWHWSSLISLTLKFASYGKNICGKNPKNPKVIPERIHLFSWNSGNKETVSKIYSKLKANKGLVYFNGNFRQMPAEIHDIKLKLCPCLDNFALIIEIYIIQNFDSPWN